MRAKAVWVAYSPLDRRRSLVSIAIPALTIDTLLQMTKLPV